MAASPEQTAANTAVGQAYGDAGATADNQKAALLQAIAQAGNAGKTAFQAQQAQTQQGRTAALGSLAQAQPGGQAPGGAFGQQLQDTVSGPGNMAAQVGASTNPGGYYDTIGKASGDYMSAVKAAIPIQREWTQRQANSLAATAASEREARAAQAARDKASSATVQAINADGTPMVGPDGKPIMVSASEYASMARGNAPTTGEQSKAAQDQRALRRADLGNRIGQDSQAIRAVDMATMDAKDLNAALTRADALAGQITTPGGKPLDTNAIRAYIRYIWSGGSIPSSQSLIAANRKATPKPKPIVTKAGPLNKAANALGINTKNSLWNKIGSGFVPGRR